MRANAKIGKLIRGVKNTFSSDPFHKNTGASPLLILEKNCDISNPSANNNSIIVVGWLIIFIISAVTPAKIITLTIASGNFGKLLIIKRKCGCKKTKKTQKTAKYTIYGVKIARSNATANSSEYIGLGRFSPWILEPSQSSSVGQKTIMISGVPEPAKNRNGVDKIIKIEASKDTLLLNHRFKRSTRSKPKSSPTIMLGSLMA